MHKRNTEDRRRRSASPSYPFKDADGATVRENRRMQPDRRLAGIEVELLEMQDEIQFRE